VPITQVSIQRFSVTSSNSFDSVLTKLKAIIGHPDMNAFNRDVTAAKDYAELERVIKKVSGARLDRRNARW